ncbi:hypothetical protein ACFY05_31885 [Microtetraspora fusca]|uniref:Uncharacterized protein n=1 Tax=Microtetraspora fusca TaxID=1997 RepID=A0ABW6VDP9_MICFU
MIAITLDMQVPHSLGSWTLAEAVNSLKASGMTRLIRNSDDLEEHFGGFQRAVRDGQTPTIGQALAAYHVAASTALDDEYYAEDSTMTPRQYGARQAAITRLVFQATRR